MIKKVFGILLVLCGIAFTGFVLTFDGFDGDPNRFVLAFSGSGLCIAGLLLNVKFRKA